jgi:nucleotide-binding universal stress UspA family protein
VVSLNHTQARHLTLDGLAINPTVARLLPLSIACRYRALPVAEANGQITVAMANPNDAAAREAVMTALGAPSCVVGGDPMVIDRLLAEVWPEALQHSLRLLICTQASPASDEVFMFAQVLGSLLDAHVNHVGPLERKEVDCEAVARLVEQSRYDLVIWEEPDQSRGQRLLSSPAYHKAIRQIGCSLLVTRGPRWPLRRLLLIVRGDETDTVAVDWTVRLARPSGALVTVLAVVPPVPAMYNGFARMQQGLDALLTTETALGQSMRRMARWLVEWEVEGTLRLRQGAPDEQIRREVAEGDYDLITVAARPDDRAVRWLLGDRVKSLLCWADRPVLIAKPTTV